MLEYLENWDRLNRTPVLDLATHQGLVVWEDDLRDLPGIHSNAVDDSGEVWLMVERLRAIRPPAVPAKLVPWLVVPDDPSKQPHHREVLPDPNDAEQDLFFEDDPALLEALQTYLEGPWLKWGAIEGPRRKSIGIYDKLFNLLQTIETEGAETALELVWGIGVAVWNTGKHRLRYPLLSVLVEIDPIGNDMALRIRPREVPPILETDPYVAMENTGLPTFEKAARTILDHPDAHVTPFDEASFEQILSGAAGTLDRHARYWPRETGFESGKVPPGCDVLTVTNTWVVFSRRKGTNFLLDDVRRLKEKVEAAEVPDGAPKVLVEDAEGAVPPRIPREWRGLSSSSAGGGAWNSETPSPMAARELYFPKPFNAEQVQIIDRLEQSSGVVVQGPPGTGKTHTIANVICHYLAEGKRVLVTSKGESALSVLRGQLPAPIQHLTVSLLTSERDGLKQLEQSVSKITTEITTLDPGETKRQIDLLKSRIEQIHQRIRGIDRELAGWAKKNIDPAPASIGAKQPTELALEVVETASRFEWFTDELDSRPEHEAAFTREDMSFLKEARSVAGSRLCYLGAPIPTETQLPTSAEMGELHRLLVEFDALTSTLDEQSIPRLRAPTRADLEDTSRLKALLETAEGVAAALRECAATRRRLDDEWMQWLRSSFANRSNPKPVFTVVMQKRTEIGALVEAARQFIGVAIEWDDEWDADEELFVAIQNSANGCSPFGILGFLPFGQQTARQRFSSIRLNGTPPKDAGQWKWIESHVVTRRQAKTLAIQWNTLSAQCPAPQLPLNPSEVIRHAESLLEQIVLVERWVTHLVPTLSGDLRVVFADNHGDSVLDDPAKMESLAQAIELRVKRKRLEEAKQLKLSTLAMLQASQLPVFQSATTFLEDEVGRQNRPSAEVENSWDGYLTEFDTIRRLSGAFVIIERVTGAIEANGAPKWAERLRIEPVVDSLEAAIPDDWASAWKWRRQYGHLLAIDGREAMHELSRRRLTLQNDLSNAYIELVEKLTWLKLKETLDQDRGLMSSLQQYMAAIRGIGAGTGVRAVRFRQNARRAMLRANQAIRCWIMPHWRVSESLPSELALFDLVIVDEASQSDLWALPSILRAKKLLVVGDNKQVSPSAVGMKEADVRMLHTRFLRALPFGDVLSPEKSVYDLASVLFASDLTRLREHFRCVEPIIEFSNRLCYNGEIRCLRVPTAEERITPPLVDVRVLDGEREGKGKVNRIEAQAIIDEIKTITSDARYAKRTIGVVSLLGGEQAQFIRDQLVSQIGEEKIIAHKIQCGDAMTFQGREADIVMISMVSDGDNVRALSGEMYEQRFNVAVSRARDRLYLFRSFRREDIRETDLRAKLIAHFQNPVHRDTERKGRERCESDFERAVYDRLNQAGYRVIPQVPAGGYRIDMVVEGGGGKRLAVECDGDQYHGADMWMADLHRQRTLERAGWTFWRCWGSSFYRDPDACMADLFATLQHLGIDPIGGMDADLTDVVEYREVYGIKKSEPIDDEIANEPPSESDETEEGEEPEPLASDEDFDVDSDTEQKRKPADVLDGEIQSSVRLVLSGCPNRSCTVDSLAGRVLKQLGLRTRSGPRAEFAKRVRRSVLTLERRGIVQRYKATNERVRLLQDELDI
jgi:very-short-patch-repair endonuclease